MPPKVDVGKDLPTYALCGVIPLPRREGQDEGKGGCEARI